MSETTSKPVIVRTYSAGVHFGFLEKHEGTQVTLSSARRLSRWFGANTLNEIANKGVDTEKSKISDPVSSITLTEAIEIIDCAPAAVESLGAAKWAA